MKKMMISRLRPVVIGCITVVLPGTLSLHAVAEDNPVFGGPDTVERQLETDREEKGSLFQTRLFEPLEGWQDNLDEKHGFGIGADYSAVSMHASDVLPGADDSASGGMVRIYGRWNLTGDG